MFFQLFWTPPGLPSGPSNLIGLSWSLHSYSNLLLLCRPLPCLPCFPPFLTSFPNVIFPCILIRMFLPTFLFPSFPRFIFLHTTYHHLTYNIFFLFILFVAYLSLLKFKLLKAMIFICFVCCYIFNACNSAWHRGMTLRDWLNEWMNEWITIHLIRW